MLKRQLSRYATPSGGIIPGFQPIASSSEEVPGAGTDHGITLSDFPASITRCAEADSKPRPALLIAGNFSTSQRHSRDGRSPEAVSNHLHVLLKLGTRFAIR